MVSIRQALKFVRGNQEVHEANGQASCWFRLTQALLLGLPRNWLNLVLLSYAFRRICFALYTISRNPGRCRHEMAKNPETAARKLR
jgi:hypothetical protein